VIGSARYVIPPDRTSCEFVIVVADKWKHHGVGHHLMSALFDCAKSQGIDKLLPAKKYMMNCAAKLENAEPCH